MTAPGTALPLAVAGLLAVVAASLLDRLVGDPRGCLHPVQVMGAAITALRGWAERWAGDAPWRLRWAGGGIAAVVLAGSVAAGWLLEWPVASVDADLPPARWLAWLVLVVALASALAVGSLTRSVRSVLRALPLAAAEESASLEAARGNLAWIVGRDVDGLEEGEILRAAAETAAENAVDGVFAPLFWMLVGAWLWSFSPHAPGPLALAWGFKAASTLDSMLGYRRGRLRWLGTAGARLDDGMVWLPCRLVALTLPLAVARPGLLARRFRLALLEGASDPSPNAGVSQAAFAHAAGVRLGGTNRYAGELRCKPLLSAASPAPDQASVERILRLSGRLVWIWLGMASMLPVGWMVVGRVVMPQ